MSNNNQNEIFQILNHINKGDYEFFQNLSQEEIRKLSPYMLMMWVNGAQKNEPIHVFMNEAIVNDKLFSLSKHPRLLLYLIVAANSEIDDTRYKFRKMTPQKQDKASSAIIQHFQCTPEQVQYYKSNLSDEELEDIIGIYHGD